MPRPAINGLTDYELSIIQILWNAAPLSVAEILEALPKVPKPAYTSLLTNVKTMEKKGYIKHVKQGKAFLYSPLLKKEDYTTFEIKKITNRLFDGNKMSLAVNLIKAEKLSPDEIQCLKDLVEGL